MAAADGADAAKPWAAVADGGLTPLHVACCSGSNSAAMVEMLLRCGADASACTDDGLDARELANAVGAADAARAIASVRSGAADDGASSGCFGKKKKKKG